MPGLTIVIPSKNERNLWACATAVSDLDNLLPMLAIDDGLKNWPQHVTVLFGAKPFGFARNVNIGISAALHDDVILLNDDALLRTPGGFTAMHKASLADPEFGIISAAVIGPSNSPEHKPQAGGGLREARGKMVPFVCVLIPRRTIHAVGMLEERFTGVYGGEDDDYCYRVRRAGLRIGIFDGCVVDHSQLKSTFRPDGRGLNIAPARARFKEIHGFEMGAR
jgi:GT2 family glycosyltransferase